MGRGEGTDLVKKILDFQKMGVGKNIKLWETYTSLLFPAPELLFPRAELLQLTAKLLIPNARLLAQIIE